MIYIYIMEVHLKLGRALKTRLSSSRAIASMDRSATCAVSSSRELRLNLRAMTCYRNVIDILSTKM